jgi:hypothetical protein
LPTSSPSGASWRVHCGALGSLSLASRVRSDRRGSGARLSRGGRRPLSGEGRARGWEDRGNRLGKRLAEGVRLEDGAPRDHAGDLRGLDQQRLGFARPHRRGRGWPADPRCGRRQSLAGSQGQAPRDQGQPALLLLPVRRTARNAPRVKFSRTLTRPRDTLSVLEL